MIIRKAIVKDAAEISEYLFLAMDTILYEFIGKKDTKLAKELLRYFVGKEKNQYSYTNCFVAESEKRIVGAINIYDGAELDRLRTPIIQYVKENFKGDFNPEKETQQGEYYIDSLGVDPKCQGKGIGTQMLQFVIDWSDANRQTLGLLVDEDNPNAEKLYVHLGFEFVGSKVLAGKKLKHLQRKPTKRNGTYNAFKM